MTSSPRIPAYLRLSRHGIYYFRIVVPMALRPRWRGRAEIKMSLHTRDQRLALRKARDLAIATHQRFEYAVGDMSVIPVNPNDPSTWPTEKSGLRKFEKTIETVKTDEGVIERVKYKVDSSSPADIAAAAADERKHHRMQRILRDPNSPEAQAFYEAEDAEIRRELEHADKLRGLALAAEEEKLRIAALAAQQAELNLQSAAENSAQLKAAAPVEPARDGVAKSAGVVMAGGGESRPPAGQAAATRNAAAKAQMDKYLLTRLWARYLPTKRKEGIDGKSEGTYQMKFDTFINWFGDTHIEEVGPEDISEYKDYLMHNAVVRAGKKRGQVGLDLPTVDNYVGVLNTFYRWAQRNGAYPRQMLIPTTDMRMFSKADKKARAQSGKMNRAFKIHELQQAFEPKLYRAENRLSHHYWPPLIALFSGMRLGEVCQLACSDIRMEDDIWAIDINDEDYKKVKSAAARRTIPMHPELVALGLPQFMQDVKELDLGPKLFPVLLPQSNGSLGNAPGKKWDLYLKEAKLTDDALTYHSFRRTANTLLKKARVDFDVRCQMVGHDLDHINEFYATEFTVAELAEMVLPKFVFKGLDLAELRYERGQFDDAIRTGLVSALEEKRVRDEKREREGTENQMQEQAQVPAGQTEQNAK